LPPSPGTGPFSSLPKIYSTSSWYIALTDNLFYLPHRPFLRQGLALQLRLALNSHPSCFNSLVLPPLPGLVSHFCLFLLRLPPYTLQRENTKREIDLISST
jgi:hypothetical protein